MTLMLAGHDTTAAGLDWLWYVIASHPEVARRCREEVDSVVGQREPSASDIEQLPCLSGTIKETLRLYPPAIGIFLRQATSDVEIGGFDVPKGSLITLSSFVTQRDSHWFPDPERFDPDRFSPERADDIPSGAYFPFWRRPSRLHRPVVRDDGDDSGGSNDAAEVRGRNSAWSGRAGACTSRWPYGPKND